MKIDKTKLLQDIEAMKEKLASMEEELNKPDEFKHFPSNGDTYYYYTPMGTVCRMVASNDKLRFDVFKTEKEAQNAYNKAIALEKIKRRIIELQGDWKPNWKDFSESKYFIILDNEYNLFIYIDVQFSNHPILMPYIKTQNIVQTIINEMEDELKLIFEIQ